jgi:hypothetical protein
LHGSAARLLQIGYSVKISFRLSADAGVRRTDIHLHIGGNIGHTGNLPCLFSLRFASAGDHDSDRVQDLFHGQTGSTQAGSDSLKMGVWRNRDHPY